MVSTAIKEHIAIVGPNGAGKTKAAEAMVRGRDAVFVTFRDSYGSYADSSFFMQQRWNLFTVDAEMPTVGEELDAAVRASREPERAERRMGELSELLGFSDMKDKLPISLSSGELRKFHLAKALLKSPGTVVLDNPYIGLDPAARRQLTDMLRSVVEEGRTQVILILSRPSEIPPFMTHVVTVRGDADALSGGSVGGGDGERQSEGGGLAGNHQAACRDGAGMRQMRPSDDAGRGLEPLKQTLDEYVAENFAPEVVRFSHVSIRFGNRVVINDLNWTVREGEHWVLTGGNGSGKSTLLSMICADNPMAYACDIALFGRQRGTGESIWDIKRRIGYVSPEMHRSFASLAVPAADIVASGFFDTEGLFRRPTDGQRGDCLGWMDMFGIGRLADCTFTRLSSGEQRLCLLARAFVKNPPLIILDEPMHGLDDRNRVMVKRLIDRICSAPGKTLIMVTHYPEDYPSCIDHSLTL